MFMTPSQTKTLLETVFERLIEANAENSNNHMDFQKWEWPAGVALYGLFHYYKGTGHQMMLDFMKEWFDRQIDLGLPPKNVNSVAPMLTLAHIYEQGKDPKYGALCNEWVNWVLNDMPRTEEGGLQHITIRADN